MKKDYQTLSFFKRGKRRLAIIKALKEPRTPKEIATECRISISNVSNALAELIKEGYAETINPDAHTYKYFGLTSKGQKALKLLSTESK